MIEAMKLRQAILDLGLEDWIPLPEIADIEEIRSEGGASVEDISTALIEFLHEGRIQIWSAPWPQDPEVVDPATAEELLRVDAQYTFNSPADRRLRVYYVNVESLRAPK